MRRQLGFVGLAPLLLTLIAALLMLVSCTAATSAGSPSAFITGSIVDARTGLPIPNATVTVNDGTGNTFSGTTGASGMWSLTSSNSGTYTVSVSEAGYFFTTPTAPIVYTAGTNLTAPVIAGLSLGSITGSSFSFILVWNGAPNALQLHLSFPDGNHASAGSLAGVVESPNWIPTTPTLLTDWGSGFGPNGNNSSGTLSATGRVIVGPSGAGFTSYTSVVTNGSSGAKITLDQNSTTGGPSTITVEDFPTTTGYLITPDLFNKFIPADTNFQGVAELYVSAPAGSLSTSTTTANAVVYVVGNSGGVANVFGVYTVPTNTTLTTVSVVRVNIMDGEFQIVPDISVVPDDDYRSVAIAPTTQKNASVIQKNGILSILRKK